MRILIIGASGTIGSAVAGELDDSGYVVLGASRRNARFSVDIGDGTSMRSLLERLRAVDALICTVGSGVYVPEADARMRGFDRALEPTVSGQMTLVRESLTHVRECIVLTAGMVAQDAEDAMVATPMSDGSLERFVRAAALEFASPRVNVVAPPLVHETARRLGAANGVPAGRVAKMYRRVLESDAHGEVFTEL